MARIRAATVGRLIGWTLVALALLAGGAELVGSLAADGWRPVRLGEIWATLDLASLYLVQAVIQRYLHPAIWDPGVISLLLWPAWIVLAVPGAVLVLACWPKGRRLIFRR